MDKRVIRVSEIFLLNNEKQILLQLRDDKDGIAGRNKWNIPGGRAKKNENPRKCIERELREEIGITLSNPMLIAKVHDFKGGLKYIHYIYYDFISLRSEELNLMEGKKIIFFSLDEIKKIENKVSWFETVYHSPLNKLKEILAKK